MASIVYNADYGGFSLSLEALVLGKKISGDENWGGPISVTYGGGRDLCRHDKTLVEVVKTLGEAANGPCAQLAIMEVEDGTAYMIREYDGNETVVFPSDVTWQIAT